MIDDERILREALAAGPTPGPWIARPRAAREQCVAMINALEVVPPDGVDLARDSIDADYIAACSPDRISRLLAEVERLREALGQANAQAEHFEREWYLRGDEVERLRATLARLACLGNGDSYGNSEGNMIARAALENTDAR